MGWIDLFRRSSPAVPDPALFNDPLALETDWVPLTSRGASFRTTTLTANGARLTYRQSAGLWAFGLLFVLVGGASVVDGGSWRLLGFLFVAVGLFVLWPRTRSFDGHEHECRLGRRVIPFGEIHALQIIGKQVHGDEMTYRSYELNLVLRDGSRANVVGHGNLEAVRGDAREISACIGCKLWDGTRARSKPVG